MSGIARVLVLGNGMLSDAVAKYLQSSFEVIRIETNYRFPADEYKTAIKAFDQEDVVIINGVGAIPQRINNFQVNHELPEWLAKNIKIAKIIHPSTDCVFQGDYTGPFSKLHGRYHLTDKPDAKSEYGKSKIEGENAFFFSGKDNFKVIRSSIIGINPNNNSGLLSWFLSQPKNSVISGFYSHYWNGVTTLEMAKLYRRVIKSWNNYNSFFQFQSKYIYSKYDLLLLFREIFDRQDISILCNSKDYSNKTLHGEIITSNIEEQLKELKGFYNL